MEGFNAVFLKTLYIFTRRLFSRWESYCWILYSSQLKYQSSYSVMVTPMNLFRHSIL